MKNLIHLSRLLAALLAAATTAHSQPTEFRVVDHAGEPVEGALVEASRAGPGNETGLTDQHGRLRLSLNPGPALYVHVSKDGYYVTSGELWRGGLYKGKSGQLEQRVLPKAFDIVLKPVIEPVALRHKAYQGRAPAIGKPAGFDLMAGDWVAPFGRGETPDLYFRFHDIVNDAGGYAGTMEISFPNPADGIQFFEAARPFSTEFGSNLAPPHRAPDAGYQPTLTRSVSHRSGTPYPGPPPPGRNYLLQTRTIRDADGTLRQACHGWIQGEIEFDPRDPKGPQLSFTYYFNPDPDPQARSLEYLPHVPKAAPRKP